MARLLLLQRIHKCPVPRGRFLHVWVIQIGGLMGSTEARRNVTPYDSQGRAVIGLANRSPCLLVGYQCTTPSVNKHWCFDLILVTYSRNLFFFSSQAKLRWFSRFIWLLIYLHIAFTIGCVKNVSKRVLKNLLAFCAATLCILMGQIAKTGFQRFFAGGKWTSKQDPPNKKWKISRRPNHCLWIVYPEARSRPG